MGAFTTEVKRNEVSHEVGKAPGFAWPCVYIDGRGSRLPAVAEFSEFQEHGSGIWLVANLGKLLLQARDD